MERRSRIGVYGNFQVITSIGDDITEEFSPKILRLFTLLLVNPDGVTAQAIDQHVWALTPVMSLKNSRNVAINRLRSLLSRLDGFEIVCDHRVFAINVSEPGYSEFQREIELRSALNGASKEKREQALREWLGIVRKGKLLPFTDHSWVVQTRDDRFEQTMSILQALRADEEIVRNPEIMLPVAETILALDGLNEPAIHSLVNTLFTLGRHGAAAQSYDQYARHFKATFGSSYPRRLEDMVSRAEH